MSDCNHAQWQPPHDYRPLERRSERRTWAVVILTGLTMLLEIAAGYWFNSMALLADGWHMASHMVAIGLAALAYLLARRYAADHRFTFGTWKIEVLAGFASALLLVVVALFMIGESLLRFWAPAAIGFDEALVGRELGVEDRVADLLREVGAVGRVGLAEHRGILDALVRHDPDTARALAEQHVLAARDTALAAIGERLDARS